MYEQFIPLIKVALLRIIALRQFVFFFCPNIVLEEGHNTLFYPVYLVCTDKYMIIIEIIIDNKAS